MEPKTPQADSKNDLVSEELLQETGKICDDILENLRQVIFGKEDLLKQVLVCLLSRGHVLLEGLPGLGKTQLVRSLSETLDLQFERIQFTPDLLPTDITGSHIIQESDEKKSFEFHRGPIFANIVLADEINRASPKTQSALLESMEEKTVTVLGNQHQLPDPFFVLATQNPIDMEGTYPLPEAQLDRFRFRLIVDDVEEETLEKILTSRPDGEAPSLEPVCDRDTLQDLLETVPKIHLSRPAARYISRIVSATHPGYDSENSFINDYVQYGASPRAGISISQAARAHALLNNRPAVDFDDVRAVAASAMNHRIILDHAASLDNVSTFDVVNNVLDNVPTMTEELPETLSTDE